MLTLFTEFGIIFVPIFVVQRTQFTTLLKLKYYVLYYDYSR